MYENLKRVKLLSSENHTHVKTGSYIKVRFRHESTTITRVLNSLLYRGIALFASKDTQSCLKIRIYEVCTSASSADSSLSTIIITAIFHCQL